MQEPKVIEGYETAREQGLPGRGGRTRRRVGILSYSSPGHYYPLTALGRRLQSRGHEVVYLQVADLERPIRAAGLEFRQIGREDFPLGALRARDEELGRLKGLAAMRCALRGIGQKAMMLFRDAPAAIRDAGVDSLIVDQIEMAGGTVAEHLGLPFVSVAAALPINLDVSVPPVNLPWPYGTGVRARLRNWVGNAACEWTFSGVVSTINRQRRAWGLPPVRNFNALFSGLAQVSQLPAAERDHQLQVQPRARLGDHPEGPEDPVLERPHRGVHQGPARVDPLPREVHRRPPRRVRPGAGVVDMGRLATRQLEGGGQLRDLGEP